MTELLVTELARRFWELAGGEEPFPRSLRPAVAYALPLAIVELPRLGVATLRRYLERRGAVYPLGAADRPLRAALVARAGEGLVLLDGTDPEDERRFSLAHEVAHFLADYWWPRQRMAQRVGRASLEVLDGRRPPTRVERIDAALGHVELAAHVHLMERTPDGHPAGRTIGEAERLADGLALELLAPEGQALAVLQAVRDRPAAALAEQFALPISVAGLLVRRLRAPEPMGATFLHGLGLGAEPVVHSPGPPSASNLADRLRKKG